ncbi:MAG: hypothetical protein B7Y61_06355 [Rhizobiales bacterium 35-66-30]|nr:MAG: hypothetical protein B7Y61_06355 [Rhizobiales bacterium 35-66-30]OZA99522.1 MAG: hypothetical protein B7X67_21275 [Rhizobiales bacterium 39-66-18]
MLALLGLGAALAAAWFLGLRAALAVGIAGLIFIAGRRGAQQGWTDREAKGDRDAQRAIDVARDARADAEWGSRDAGRLRDDDGWRRD